MAQGGGVGEQRGSTLDQVEPGAGAALRLRDLPAAGVDLRALVDLLLSVDAADLSEPDLVAAAVGWQQVAAIVTAAQAAVVGELAARRPGSPCSPGDDLACALSLTGHGAAALVGRAAGLEAHPVLVEGLRAGVLDARKVDVLLDEVARLPERDADRVLAALVANAEGLTTGLLRVRARRLVAAVDPDAAAKRAAKARSDRRVRLDHAPDSMAWITVLLPAPDAVAVFSVIDALAGAAHTSDDPRTVAQRRADAFTDVFAAILATGHAPDGTALPTRQGNAPGLHLTVAAGTLAGRDDLPGELAGYGPIPAEVARELAAQADRYRPALVDEAGHLLALGDRTIPIPAPHGELDAARPGGGVEARAAQPARRAAPVGYRPGAGLRRFVVARDQTCMFPGCRQPAERCDLDHVDPYDHDRSPVEQTIAANLQPLCRHHHRTKTLHGWRMHRDPATGDVHTTSPDGLTYVRSATTVLLTPAACRHALPGARNAGTQAAGAATAGAATAGTTPTGGAPFRLEPHDDEPPPF